MPWPAAAYDQYLLPLAPTTVAPAASPSAEEMVTYYVDGAHNVQVKDDLLGAHETPNKGDALSATQSEAAFEGGPRAFFIEKGGPNMISTSFLYLNI